MEQPMLYRYETVDSTNTVCKALAQQGAEDGTAVIAARQPAGRGRMGRGFESPAGLGLYLSMLWRPVASPEGLLPLTAMVSASAVLAIRRVTGADGRTLDIVAESVGGGRIRVCSIDGITANFTGEHNTLIVHNQDAPGHVSAVSSALTQRQVNIATMQLYRSEQGGYAVMILECDQPIPKDIEQWLSHIEGIQKITIFNQEEPV